MTKIGDKIEQGEPIPANVVAMADGVEDEWRRHAGGLYVCARTDWRLRQDGTAVWMAAGEQTSGTPKHWWPMTVVEVDPEPQQRACFKCGGTAGAIVDRNPAETYASEATRFMHAYGSCESNGEITERIAETFGLEWPRPEPQPERDVEDDVHYYVSELRPGSTFCGIGLEEDNDLSTTDEAGKATCDPCRAEADEGAFMRRPATCGHLGLLDKIAGILGVLPEDDLADAVWRLVSAPASADPGPLVLTLPVAPKDAVALIFRQDPADPIRFTPVEGALPWRMVDSAGTAHYWSLIDLIAHYGPVEVVMREPRTWPKLDALPVPPWEMDKVEVDGHGTWYRHQHRNEDWWHQGDDSDRLSFPELCTLGEVREVLT